MCRSPRALRAAAAALALLGLTGGAAAFAPPGRVAARAATVDAGPAGVASSAAPATKLGVFSFLKREEAVEPPAPAAVPGIGAEGCALPSPSGVNALPESRQAAIFAAIYAGLGVGTYLLSTFLGEITLQYEWAQSWRYTWPILGAVYALAGAAHFAVEEDFVNIYPTKGAWGFWNLPGSPEFHSRWTGVAEILGGVGLLIGGFYDAFLPPYTQFPNVLTPAGIGPDAAAGLFLLTLAVTPANIFMYTHGAKLPMYDPEGELGPEVPVVGHAIRGLLQVVLLAMLYQMGDGAFDSIASGTFGCPTC